MEHIIQSWVRVHKNCPEAHLVLLGSGGNHRNIEGELKEQVQSLKLEQSIHFLGEVADVMPYLLAADIFILASVSEGLSNALLEAMAVGLCVVCTRIPAHEHFLEDHINCQLVEYADIEGLASILERVLKDSQLREHLARAAREIAESEFSMEKIVERHEILYKGLLQSAECQVADKEVAATHLI